MPSPLFTFVHVTDTHWHRDHHSDRQMRRFVDAINKETFFPLPDFIIHTGDIIRGYNDTIEEHYTQMREAKAVLDRLKPRAYYTCHNHDTIGEDVRGVVFDEVFGAPHAQEIERNGFYFLILSGRLASSDIYGDWGGDPELGRVGFDIHTPSGRTLIRSRMEARSGHNKLLFSHAGLVSPRKITTAENSELPVPRKSGYRYSMGEAAAAGVREVLSRCGVTAHYCGNSHVNSRLRRGGVEYVTTCALAQYPGEARHVTVYEDRLVHRIMPVGGGREGGFRWPNVTDADHATNRIYMAGNPEEREFTIAVP